MSHQYPRCSCSHPQYCRCPFSRFAHYGDAVPLTTAIHQANVLQHPGPEHPAAAPYSVSSAHYIQAPTPHPHLYQTSVTPYQQWSSETASGSGSRPILGNITSSTQNTVPSEEPPSRKRKSTSDPTGGGKSKKPRQPRTSVLNEATVLSPLRPEDTAQVVGVGPTQPLSGPPPGLTTDSTLNPTLQSIRDTVFRKSRGSIKTSAVDVYTFVMPMSTDKPPLDSDIGSPLTAEGLKADSGSRTLLTSKPNTPYVRCRLCADWKVWKNGDGMTTTVRRHLDSKHKEVYQECLKVLGIQSNSGNPDSESTRDSEPFSVEKWIGMMLDWIVVDDVPLSVVEGEEFRRWVLYGTREAAESDLPHKDALTNQIYKQYLQDYDDLIKEMGSSLGRVSLTSDIWSDPNLTPFIAMTCHFCKRAGISGPLKIVNRLLAFRVVEGPHDGENIGQIMYDIMKDAGINQKIGQITLDNASNCDTAMRKIERCCASEGISFDSDGNHNRCFPHVINIAASTVAKELKENPRMVVSTVIQNLRTLEPERILSSEELQALKDYEDAVAADPAGMARTIVSSCRSSGQRRAELKAIIESGNSAGTWSLRVLQLLRDVETRWSSYYNMIGRVIYLYSPLLFFLIHSNNGALRHLQFTAHQWKVLNDIHDIFEIPHGTQQLLSAEKTPTIALALPAFELLIQSWTNKQKAIPELAHFIGVGISKIQEYVRKCRRSRIYGLAMIINPEYKLHWIRANWSPQESQHARDWMVEAMTSFCTAMRKEKQAANVLNAQLNAGGSLRSTSTLPNLSQSACDIASRNLSNGMNNLLSISKSSSTRRTVSLPVLPPTVLSAPSTSSSSASPIQSLLGPHPNTVRPQSSQSQSEPSTTPAETLRLTPEEIEKAEAQNLLDDRRTAEKEFGRYLDASSTSIPCTDNLVRFWDHNEDRYPLMFRVALDILPVQASSVPCERIFSSSKETCSDRRNRILPRLLEVLQLRKFKLKQVRLDFMDGFTDKDEDYSIDGHLTKFAVEELLKLGPRGADELASLIQNSRDALLS